MAIMCPTKPREIEKNSKEDLMFKMLEKLSDSYYVFHSFSIVDVSNSVLYEDIKFILTQPFLVPCGLHNNLMVFNYINKLSDL